MTDRGFENIGERSKMALLVVVALLVYGNTLWNGFTLDDHGYILHNPAVTHFSVRGLFEPNRANNVLRPVTFATLALNWAAGDEHPFGYHLLNVLLQRSQPSSIRTIARLAQIDRRSSKKASTHASLARCS